MTNSRDFSLHCGRRDFLWATTLAGVGLWCPTCVTSPLSAETAVKKQLKEVSAAPLNAEPELGSLMNSSTTALEHFFVRCHGTIPATNAADFTLSVDGLVHRPLKLTLTEIQQRFAKQEVEATLTCAGNRRMELSTLKKVAGVAWDAGAIGNARWAGVALGDVLKAAELKSGAKHVWFEGADSVREKDGSVAPFGASIPLEKALAIEGQIPGALIAYLMNGLPLLPEHGFPFRTVVPGFIGARSVKWLQKIVVSDRPSPNHYVADAYKLVQNDSVEERAAQKPIYEFVVNGAICQPASGSRIKSGRMKVSGYALPSGKAGSKIQQVSLSQNDGRTWIDAKLDGESRQFCWQLWSADIPIDRTTTRLTLRVTDSLGNVQPQIGAWNLKGYLYNGWHNTSVSVE